MHRVEHTDQARHARRARPPAGRRAPRTAAAPRPRRTTATPGTPSAPQPSRGDRPPTPSRPSSRSSRNPPCTRSWIEVSSRSIIRPSSSACAARSATSRARASSRGSVTTSRPHAPPWMPTGVVSQASGPPRPVVRRNGVSRDRRSQSVSSRSTGSPRAAVDQHPAGQVLEHHRAAGQLGRGLDQPRHRRPLQPELGEGPVHVAGEPHLLELLGHDRPVHALGHVDEPHRPVQRDQREARPRGPGAAPAPAPRGTPR